MNVPSIAFKNSLNKGFPVDKYGDIVNPERRKNRKDSQNRSEKVKVIEDILDDIDGQVNVMFTANDWKSLPKCSPEEVLDLSVAERVSKFKSSDDTLSTIQAQLLLLLDNESQRTKPLMSEVVARGVSQAQYSTGSEQNGSGGRQTCTIPKEVLGSGMNQNDTFQLPPYEKRRQMKELNRVQRNTDQQNARVNV